ncbi:MAG: HU family DNA-binding protein [Desulfurobacteriaceae bacterium]
MTPRKLPNHLPLLKEDIVTMITERLNEKGYNFTRKTTRDFLNTFLKVLEECFKEGRTVKLREFGIFRISLLSREINSPFSKQGAVELKGYKTIRFKASRKLLKKLNE